MDFVGFALAAVGAVVLAFAGVVLLLFRALSLAVALPLFLAFPSLFRIGGRPG